MEAVYQIFNTNHLSYTKTLVPIYRFRAINKFYGASIILEKNGIFTKKIKTLTWAIFLEAFIVAPSFLDMCLEGCIWGLN